MSTPVATFFNNKGGVGKTSLVFHLAWMMREMGGRVVAIDLDPQANLTAAFLPEETLEELWTGAASATEARTIFQCVKPLTEVGDLLEPVTFEIDSGLHLVPGDIALASFEELLSQEWPNSLGSNLYRPFRILSAFWQVAQLAASRHGADIILADVGPNLGAINRSALIASDHVIIPLAADMFSLQGLRNIGPTLRRWRGDWERRTANWSTPPFELPQGAMRPAGYVLLQHAERFGRPVKAYAKWANRIPAEYRASVLMTEVPQPISVETDSFCLARLKNYRSLMPMAQDVSKPIFKLTAADGAIGSHAHAVSSARKDFRELADAVLRSIGVSFDARS